MHGTKWADYIITEVNQVNGSIAFVKVMLDNGENLEYYRILSKQEIIKHLENKKNIITSYKKIGSNQFIYGSEVELYIDIYGNKQFKTKSNHLSPDNLDNLPKF